MWTAYTLAALGAPFCLVKLILFHYVRNPLPAVFVLMANMGFTVRLQWWLSNGFLIYDVRVGHEMHSLAHDVVHNSSALQFWQGSWP